jgi:hypothetical protein
MLKLCHLIEIARGDTHCGTIWLLPVLPNVVEAHCVIYPKFHRRWLTKGVVMRLTELYQELELKALFAQTPTEYHTRIWTALGAEDHGVYAILRKKHHG